MIAKILQTIPQDPIGIVSVIIFVLIIVAIWKSIIIVQAYEKKALTVFGEYRRLLEPGINFVQPFVSKTYTFDMRTQTVDVSTQEAITRDNSPVTCDAVVYMRVMNAKKAFLEVDNYKRAVSNLAQTTLRSVIGDMELDDTLNKRQEINARIRQSLDEATDSWGIRVESVEVREVMPSQDVQDAMEQQTSAERRKRAMILEAEGERRSAIEKAQGDRKSSVIRAQGEKQSDILRAQGDSLATVLRSKAAKTLDERAITERGIEALEEIGKGESTKYIIPQELTSAIGRYAKHISGGIESDGKQLESVELDEETKKMLGIDNLEDILEDIGTEVSDIDEKIGDIEEVKLDETTQVGDIEENTKD